MCRSLRDVRSLVNCLFVSAFLFGLRDVQCVGRVGRASASDSVASYRISPGFVVPSRPHRRLPCVRRLALPLALEEDEPPGTYSEQLYHHRAELQGAAPPSGDRYYILAIETSCDDACAAIVSSAGEVLAEEHASNPDSLVRFGGIKPDESSRFHMENLDPAIERVIAKSGVAMTDVKRIAVTRGPGMNICLKVGYESAARLAAKHGIPLICENHLAGHCLSPFISGHQFRVSHGQPAEPSTALRYPFLALLLSGGHSQMYVVESASKFHMLGDTMDHYAGNVLHKCAKDLGLPIDSGGGPAIEDAAAKALGPLPFQLTEPSKDMYFTSFCFSGIQTQLREMLLRLRKSYGEDVLTQRPELLHQLARACQEVTFQQILRQLLKAMDVCDTLFGIKQLVVVGGVSCNKRLRGLIAEALHGRERNTVARAAAFSTRMYGLMKKFGLMRRFQRNDGPENMLIQNLIDRMSGVSELPQLLRLLWGQDLYPDLLQRREGIHLSVQQKNAFYSALVQAYFSVVSDSAFYMMQRNIQMRRHSAAHPLGPSPTVLRELSNLERQSGSELITRHMGSGQGTPRRWQLFTTSGEYCTDNAVMIAYSLLEKHRAGMDGPRSTMFYEPVTDRWNLSHRRHWELLADIARLHSLSEA